MTNKLKRGDYRALEDLLREMLGLNESPVGFQYTDLEPKGARTAIKKSRVCIYPFLNMARKGETVYFSREWKACRGGAFYLGFKKSLMKGIGHFLSHGIPGRIEGERFKKTPELGEALSDEIEFVPATGQYIVFRPLKDFTEEEPPEAVTIYGNGDVMGAMIVMANYAREGNDEVITQFSSGCYSMVTEPRIQSRNKSPKAVLGSFDIACRPFIDPSIMTFSMTADHLWEMALDMGESFLTINPWLKIKGRGK
ncbi:MAG: DUF169 domain-containing protein [Deltaproteobacteria bacterium]|uniref:DUF169 domain-containing protein n=1 Tax=Candidatus Zymogenus saltonus TaxID=2844893 RepID=A0A9D8PN00_9DELT|nr:DUF169 domain-containing protein [Candidatus Zymogenus saltonus]